MLSSPEPELGFDLDYEDLGETRKLKVDPWTGDVLPGQPNDPDRTRRIKVDPWTGKVLTKEHDDFPSSVRQLEPLAAYEPVSDAPLEPRIAFPLVAFVVVISLVAGGALGSFVTLLVHSL